MKEEIRGKIERLFGRLLLVGFLLVCTVVWIRVFSVGEKRSSFEQEARNAERFPALTVSSFLSGDFQDKLDAAISDNMPKSEAIRRAVLDAQNTVFNQLSWITINPNSGYQLVAKGYFTYDGYDYLVRPANSETMMNFVYSDTKEAAEYRALAKKSAEFFGALPIKNKYLYIINTDKDINFDSPNLTLGKQISGYFDGWKFSELNITDFDTYRNFYYKNDHHWNYRGQYQGYKDIVNLLFDGKEKPLEPVEEVNFKYQIIGSKDRLGNYHGFSENFSAYRFERGEFDAYMNGVLGTYDAWDEFFNNEKKRTGTGKIKYADFYGKDYAVVEFDYHQPEKENLIIVGLSDTNSINSLIASHFNKTWDIDPRHCSPEQFEKIIQENEIQNILLLPYGSGIFMHNALLMEGK